MVLSKIERELRLVACMVGIYACYIYYGIVQEKITKEKYDGERFPSVLFLVLVQCVIAAIGAKVPALFGLSEKPKKKSTSTPSKKVKEDGANAKEIPLVYQYALLAFSYLGAMLMSNYSLKFVDYPTSVLAKSVKPIPVMLMSVLLNAKKYSVAKYLRVVLMTIGVALFMYHPGEAASEKKTHMMGYLLLMLSLSMDGITGPFQEKILSSKSHNDEMEIMFYTNSWSALYLTVGVLVVGDAIPVYEFLSLHPRIILDILQFAVCSAVGQCIIYYTIAHWSSLVCSIITTTRKFLTILASVLYYGHVLSYQQWFGVAIVFAALFAEVLSSYTSSAHAHLKDHKERTPSTPQHTHDLRATRSITSPTSPRRTPSRSASASKKKM